MAEKTKYDPLEAAKVTEKTKAQDDESLAQTDWGAKPPPPASKTARASAPTVVTPVAPAATKTVYEVTAPKLVSLGGGNVHRFKVGDRLDPAGYGGDEGIARLGLDLKKVEV